MKSEPIWELRLYVAGQTTRMRDVQTAEPQRHAFCERVDVDARAHPQHLSL